MGTRTALSMLSTREAIVVSGRRLPWRTRPSVVLRTGDGVTRKKMCVVENFWVLGVKLV
jgi:hypothetical protein